MLQPLARTILPILISALAAGTDDLQTKILELFLTFGLSKDLIMFEVLHITPLLQSDQQHIRDLVSDVLDLWFSYNHNAESVVVLESVARSVFGRRAYARKFVLDWTPRRWWWSYRNWDQDVRTSSIGVLKHLRQTYPSVFDALTTPGVLEVVPVSSERSDELGM